MDMIIIKNLSFYYMSFEKIKRSLKYGALDHKWLARDYLWKKHQTSNLLPEAKEGSQQDTDTDADTEPDMSDKYLYKITTSPFGYYKQYYDVFQQDVSLKAITKLCSDEILTLYTEHHDSQVFHLSNIFNQIIESARNLHRCYDCGTNARAIFLKLIETHRGISYVSHEEQQKMKDEYRVTHTQVPEEVEKCYQRLKSSVQDEIFIMSLSLQNFGHVWVIEKIFIDNAGTDSVPRYHHYQSSYRSHLLLDFIESKDYGRDPNQSLDIGRFFSDIAGLLSITDKWTDKEYRLFAKIFAFLPVSDIIEPNPGFSFTSIAY
jgi:hypothetical protein